MWVLICASQLLKINDNTSHSILYNKRKVATRNKRCFADIERTSKVAHRVSCWCEIAAVGWVMVRLRQGGDAVGWRGVHGRLGGCRQCTLCTTYISCMRSQCRAHIHLYIFLGHTYIYNLRTRLHIYELSMQSTSACNICPLRRFPNLDAALLLGDNILVQEGERLQFQN